MTGRLSDDELMAWWHEVIERLRALTPDDWDELELLCDYCEAFQDEANKRIAAGLWSPSDDSPGDPPV